jgi:hypothetical protein
MKNPRATRNPSTIVNRTVTPRRPPNADLREREYLTPGNPENGHFPHTAFLRRSEAEVALLRLLQLQGREFDPAVVIMVTAFDDTLRELKPSSRHDPLVERVAQITLSVRKSGCAMLPRCGLVR